MITRSAERRNRQLMCNIHTAENSVSEIKIPSPNAVSAGNQSYIVSHKNQKSELSFNIHFHIPKCETSTIKLYIPDIQPVVHFHFKDGNKTVKCNNGKKGKDICNISISNLSDIETPHEDDSEEKFSAESQNKRILRSSFKCVTDNESAVAVNTRESSKNIKTDNHKDSKKCIGMSENNSKSKSSNYSKEISDFKFDKKLYKAVVVLTDVCKTDYYKRRFQAAAVKNEIKGNKSKNENEANKVVNSSEIVGESLKSNDELTRKYSGCSSTVRELDKLMSETANISCLPKKRILTELAEGCNFSEILNIFKFKYANSQANSTGCSDATGSENFSDSIKHEPELQQNKNSKSHGNQELTFSGNKLNENEVEKTYCNKIRNFSTPHSKKEVESTDFEKSKMSNPLQSTFCGELTQDTEMQASDAESGDNCVKEKQSSLQKAIFDEETIQADCVAANKIDNNNTCNVPEKPHKHLNNMGNSEATLNGLNKKMSRKKFPSKRKSKVKKIGKAKDQVAKSDQSSAQKETVKQSNEKSKKLDNKELTADYIPLQASGPTKFGVAVVNRIQPFRQHRATEFKDKFLFGDRVKRYSSPYDLRMYKLKHEATRRLIESAKKF